MANTASPNIQSLGADGLYGTYTVVGGGGGVGARNELDRMRIGVGQTPEAMYPDGYLGEVRSRRGDRILNNLHARANDRPYLRGVHKGERIAPRDYVWPTELQPTRGLVNEARGVRTAPVGVTPVMLVNDGKAEQNPIMAAKLSNLRPTWR